MSSIINTVNHFYDQQIVEHPQTDFEPFIKKSGYRYLSTAIKAAIQRGEIYYLAVEFYPHDTNEIWAEPNKAWFALSSSRFKWQNRIYSDRIKSIPELKKFIGRTFNSFSIEMMNVERGSKSGSRFVTDNLIKGFRVAVRLVFPELDEVKYSRLIWWGRVANVEDINEETAKINCTQEIGDFSYELATQKYGSGCPLWFGRGDCLGNETLEQKSLLYQQAFVQFGQGGCNRTEARCNQLGNIKFYQGQKVVVINGQFFREEKTTKTILWFFHKTKTTLVPVQYSAKNQSDNDSKTIPLAFGRVQVQLHPFTWVDRGTFIDALMAGCKNTIEGFYNIICRNRKFTILSVTPHLGELGGEGTQQPDPRFPDSGFNSKLAYIGITFGGSPPDNEPEENPATTSVMKAAIVPVRNRFGEFVTEWSVNGVWIARWLMMNFPFTVVRPEWFNEEKNQETADYNFVVVEDDTEAEIPVVTGSAFTQYQNGDWQRFPTTARFNAAAYEQQFSAARQESIVSRHSEHSQLLPELLISPLEDPIDIIFGDGLGVVPPIPPRTYLALRYTTNFVVAEKSTLIDLLFGIVFPTFKGFMKFNQFGQIEIDSRKPADNSFLRSNVPLASTEIPVASTVKFRESYGYLLIGVGRKGAEIARIRGIRYVNGSALTVVSLTTQGTIGAVTQAAFIDRTNAPSEIIIDFSGTPSTGDKIELKFTEPNGDVLKWDYFVDDSSDSLETITQMFKTRLNASPSFRESWTAEVFGGYPTRVYVRCQTGYVQLDRALLNDHEIGEEVLRVVEVYEDGKDGEHPHGLRDNMKGFVLNTRKQANYHGVKGTYISAVQDFRETEIQPRIAWDSVEQERNLNLLDLDLRGVDNYRQAAFLIKSATINFVDGNLPSEFQTGIMGMFHDEGEVIAVRHQTMEGISYTPFTIEELAFNAEAQETSLGIRLYLSAAFDERVAKEEKFLDTTLTPNTAPHTTPPPILSPGGYSSTGTGDGAGDSRQNIKFETQAYETFPNQQRYSPEGRDKL